MEDTWGYWGTHWESGTWTWGCILQILFLLLNLPKSSFPSLSPYFLLSTLTTTTSQNRNL